VQQDNEEGESMTATRLALLASVLALVPSPVFATSLANGDFSAGLTAWTSTGGVSDGGGFALIRDTSFFNSLDQTFTIPVGAVSLSFDYTFASTGPTTPASDTFAANLLDPSPSFSPILSKSPTDDWFLLIDSATGTDKASMVTLSGNHVTLDLSSVTLPKSALLTFDLIGGNGLPDARLTIDNVSILQQVNAIPEPVTLAAIPLGVLAVGAYLQRRRKLAGGVSLGM